MSDLDRTNPLLPSSVQAALDAEADLWAKETDVAAWVAHMSQDERSRGMLIRIAKACFAEGAYRGACNVIDGKSLQASILEAREITPSQRAAVWFAGTQGETSSLPQSEVNEVVRETMDRIAHPPADEGDQ